MHVGSRCGNLAQSLDRALNDNNGQWHGQYVLKA